MFKIKSPHEVLELLTKPNTTLRCWKCLRLYQDEKHECAQEAVKFMVMSHGDLRGSCGELISAYPLSQSEVERLGGEIDE